eukprot:GHVU01198592.1.p1 GENE.GHVU01198592.1~~GHVU01198592.1.p1  ORF type:complete len:894 (+),score=71.71 GHVU01198592.1:1173-3854(+)
MKTTVPRFNDITRPLWECLERVKTAADSKKIKPCGKIVLGPAIGWDEECEQAVTNLKLALRESVRLAFPDKDKDILVFTDASELHWGAVITQVDSSTWQQCIAKAADDNAPCLRRRRIVPSPPLGVIAALDHQPLAFVSGTFKEAQTRWSVVEKEAFPVKQVLERYEYLLLRGKGFYILTDHKNLLFILGKDPGEFLKTYVRDKLHRWYLRIASMPYFICYLPGVENTWADMFSRWGAAVEASPPTEVLTVDAERVDAYISAFACETVLDVECVESDDVRGIIGPVGEELCAIQCQLPHPGPDEVVFPTLDEIKHEQDLHAATRPKGLMHDERLIYRYVHPESDSLPGPIWLPRECEDLLIRVLVIGHARDGAHSSQEGTFSLIGSKFKWVAMANDIAQFCRECIHCMRGASDWVVPRPLGETMMATRPNEIVHVDYLTMDTATTGERYLLIVKCNYTGLVRLIECTRANAESTAKALSEWCRYYTPPEWLVSDGGSHFKNEVLELLTEQFHIKHHITLASCPWANGAIENMCGFALRLFRVLGSAGDNLRNADWPSLAPLVEYRVNDVPYRRDGLTARQCFINPTVGKTRAFAELDGGIDVRDVAESDWTAVQESAWEDFKQSLDMMHAAKAIKREGYLIKLRTPAPARRFKPLSLREGAIVMVARGERHKDGQKLSYRWMGPKRVIFVESPFIFSVEDILMPGDPAVPKVRKVHACRLKLYCDPERGDETRLHKAAAGQKDEFTINAIMGARVGPDKKTFQLFIQWEGFENVTDSWEPLKAMAEDVPVHVWRYLVENVESLPVGIVHEAKKWIKQVVQDASPLPAEDFGRVPRPKTQAKAQAKAKVQAKARSRTVEPPPRVRPEVPDIEDLAGRPRARGRGQPRPPPRDRG